MTQDEILSAAKEVGFHEFYWTQTYHIELVEAFAKIIERKTIERCAKRSEQYHNHSIDWKLLDVSDCAAAIRKLGEE